jgi:SAM-dependent methyltransferase
MNPDIRKFWQTADFRHINPAADTEFPEGWDVREELRESLGGRFVAEIGCGYGRLCTAFQPEQYAGYDLSPAAIAEAQRRFPDYRFAVMAGDDDFAASEAVLLYTVLLHVHDHDIEAFIERLTVKTGFVLVAEVMGRAWRREGDPPVFNRERQEYIDLFARQGFVLDDIITAPYARYKNTQITFLTFNNNRPAHERQTA